MNHNNFILRFPCHISDTITQSLSNQQKNNPPKKSAQDSKLGIPNPNKNIEPEEQTARETVAFCWNELRTSYGLVWIRGRPKRLAISFFCSIAFLAASRFGSRCRSPANNTKQLKAALAAYSTNSCKNFVSDEPPISLSLFLPSV